MKGVKMDESFLQTLDRARERSGLPFYVSSGMRCEKHNLAVNGAATSSHLSGKAADIYCQTSGDRYLMVRAMMQSGMLQIILYKNHIHCGLDPDKSTGTLMLG